MDALWNRCAELGMPINIHVSDPIWSYQKQDNTNDGLMNGYSWRIDDTQPGILGHDGLIQSLERAVEKHRKTIFIACHLANLEYDLTRLGGMLDRHPNLFTDISARFAEVAPIPRARPVPPQVPGPRPLRHRHALYAAHVQHHVPHHGIERRAFLRAGPLFQLRLPLAHTGSACRPAAEEDLPRQRRGPSGVLGIAGLEGPDLRQLSGMRREFDCVAAPGKR